VGENRLELLLFRLAGRQLYGINVFKVREVIQCPRLTHVPNARSIVRGIAKLRGQTIPIIDLGMAIGGLGIEDISKSYVVVAEYNRSINGFLVHGVERIINMNWQEIMSPPKGSGRNTYMTAVTKVDDKLVEIIDVEKVLSDIAGFAVMKADTDYGIAKHGEKPLRVLVADDSSVARKQIQRTLEQLGIETIMTEDGRQALNLLQKWIADNGNVFEHIDLVISDIEMPSMDGYTLTAEIRKHPGLRSLYVILHTSLSGIFNQAMVEKVGADFFVSKFKPDEFAQAVVNAVKSLKHRQAAA
jgi:two-component system chemotaxis response regulator CheV